MGRVDRRRAAAEERKGVVVSPSLLRKVLAQREEELALHRRLLFGILRRQGRVKLLESDVAALTQDDHLDVRHENGEIFLEYVRGGEPKSA